MRSSLLFFLPFLITIGSIGAIGSIFANSPKQNPKNFNVSSALELALNLKPPDAISVNGGDTEGSDWWLEHDHLLRLAWKEWNDLETNVLPSLDSKLIDPNLRCAMDQTKHSPTLQNEASVHENWQAIHSDANENETPDSTDKNPHRVYRYNNFLTPDGIQKLRLHLESLSKNGIPKRRPNAMNRNGLLLDPTIPGGISADEDLQNFVEILASDYLRPLGRSLFPEFAGDVNDDAKHYAFTIQYGVDEKVAPSSPNATTATTTVDAITAATDLDLKEHSDASLYTLNINLNLPDEDYSGSSLYFSTNQQKADDTNSLSEVTFEPGTALLHRGMTKHGARPLEGGKRNNLVIWLHGVDGYVRVAPYPQGERLSLYERWASNQQQQQQQFFADTLNANRLNTSEL